MALPGLFPRTLRCRCGAAPGEAMPEPDSGSAAMTVAIAGEPRTRRGIAALVARLAELAVNDELLVVYGSADKVPGRAAHAVLAGLRDRLPRHNLVAVQLRRTAEPVGWRDSALLGELVESGAVPMVITAASAAPQVAVTLSTYLRADRILPVT